MNRSCVVGQNKMWGKLRWLVCRLCLTFYFARIANTACPKIVCLFIKNPNSSSLAARLFKICFYSYCVYFFNGISRYIGTSCDCLRSCNASKKILWNNCSRVFCNCNSLLLILSISKKRNFCLVRCKRTFNTSSLQARMSWSCLNFSSKWYYFKIAILPVCLANL